MNTRHLSDYAEALQCIQMARLNRSREACLNNLVALERLPDELADLTELRILRVNHCYNLKDISILRSCSSLIALDLRVCHQLQDLRPLTKLTALQSLDLHGDHQIQDLQPLANLTSLQSLNLSGCDQLQNLQPLANLTALQSLYLSGCRLLQNLQPLANLTNLQSLNLRGCDQLQDLRPLTKLTALQNLPLSFCLQLHDLRPLANLIALQNLDLSGCNQLQDLQPLANLTALQSLSLSFCLLLQDLQPLTKLTDLQNLSLRYCSQLQNLQPLAELTALQNLDLYGCNQLQDLQPLANFITLQNLDLSECNQLQDLQPLTNLTDLHSLNLSGCNQLQDLQPLANLTALQNLNLRDCSQILNFQPLANLTALQILDLSGCNQLQDLQPLANLTDLQNLSLRDCNQILNFQLLANLTALQSLNLGDCNQLQDLQPLASLPKLKEINLFNAGYLDCSLRAQPLLSWRDLNTLYANRLLAAPTELGSRDTTDNALGRIRAWQQDLTSGEAPNSTVKLFVLGNGEVGKTQICRRLCSESFDSSIPSTHGIRLGQFRLIQARGEQLAVDVHFWDFGGQDIYLGTHALFLDERAIYVIAWNPKYENVKDYEKHGTPMRNRPLVYWLEYVYSLAGPQAPVIVVQTMCDRELDVQSAPTPTKHGFERLRVTSSSAKQDDGMEQLQIELKRAAIYQLERYGKVCLPSSWVAIGEDLDSKIHAKTIALTEFEELCHAKHGSAVPSVVLEYLHRSGRVFWRKGLFGNQIVLDLSWALDGVYAVLERNTALPEIRRQAGRFSPQLLEVLVWRNYREAERQLFLSLMKQCQICFQVATDVYIAPSLLPAQETVEMAVEQVWRGSLPKAEVCLKYTFLHEGVLRAMLCNIGQIAGVHAVYWAYGVCFYDIEKRSTVRIGSTLPDAASGQTSGSITVEATGPKATQLATHITNSIQRLNIGQPPQIIWKSGQADQISQNAYEEVAEANDEAFAEVKPAQPPRLEGEAKPVYVSYSWEDESEELVDTFQQRLPTSFKLIRDKQKMRPGDWISKFMADIGRADRVLVR